MPNSDSERMEESDEDYEVITIISDTLKKCVSSDPLYICDICGKNYVSQSHFNEHSKREHEKAISNRKSTVKCPLCETFVKMYEELDTHLKMHHKVEIEHQKIQFKNMEEFEKWKMDMELDTKSSYVKLNSRKRSCGETSKFGCYRSGFFKPHIKGPSRKRKVKDSNKIGSHCPSRLICIEENTQVSVDYVPTHVGHDIEIARLRLSAHERAQIAEKLMQGIPYQRILQDIPNEFDPNKRISLTTKKDIFNIKKSFGIECNISSSEIFHTEDATSVAILTEKMGNAVLHYKPYGVEDTVLEKNDFFMAFMNSTQRDMLVKYGNNILMIDSTYSIKQYNIQLKTLMIVDEEYEGFPVAFLWTIVANEAVFQRFFHCIKERIPELNPKIFLSDDNTFYDTFVKVYNCNPSKTLFPDPDTKRYLKSLKKWHQQIKKYSVAANWQRLDRAINNVLECFRKIFMGRLLSMSPNKVPWKLAELIKRHKLAQQFRDFSTIFEENADSKWLVSTSKNSNDMLTLEYYTVTKNQEECDCNFICTECNCCIHIFSCSCDDYSIEFNMCKHVHLVNLNKKIEIDMSEPVSSSIGSHEEYTIICSYNTELQNQKNIALDKLNELKTYIENCDNLDSIIYVTSNLTNILAGFTDLNKNDEKPIEIPKPIVQVPSNQKITCQKQSLPAKKMIKLEEH